MINGEAPHHVSDSLKQQYPNLPWREIVGFRNVITHEYFGLIWDRVWLAASTGTPALRARVSEILTIEFPESIAPAEGQ